MHDHLTKLHRALTEEQRAEAAEHERLAGLPHGAQIAAGFAWPPLTVVACERAGRRFRLTVRADRGVVLHESIVSGSPVSVDSLEGTCIGVDDDHATLLLRDPVDEGRTVRIAQRHDPTTFIRYRQALERADETSTPLRDALLGSAPTEEITLSEVVFDGLDSAQTAAARYALSAPSLAAIQGPPGTGKTRLLAAVLAALVARGKRCWALADSNAAVDHLALRAADEGLAVLRLGHSARIGSAAAPLSLDARIATSHLGPALVALDREIARTEGRELRNMFRERRRLRLQARALVIESADVIAATFGTLARLAPELPAADTAVVDEATQATEPAVWVTVPFVKRLVLVGDPNQLGPVSKARTCLEQSLLQRLLDEARTPLPMLEVQWRMATPIRALVADIYGADYRDHPSAADQSLDALPPTRWIDTAGAALRETIDPATRSLFNEGEAALVAIAVADLRERGVQPDRIGVITPYSAQVACLKRQPALAGVDVATVNAFQGREKDAIAVSWVRSNDDGDVGFVADPRRLTVAITRARKWLCFVGDSATLAGHARFAALIAEHERLGTLYSAWEFPWSVVLTDLA